MTRFFVIIFTFVTFLFYLAALYLISRRRHADQARRLGYFLGISFVLKLLQADREKHLLDWLVELVDEFSDRERRFVFTFSLKIARIQNYFTVDLKNLQAMLATQFKEFELGEARNIFFFPLLGKGIEHSCALLRPQFAKDYPFFRLALDSATEFLLGSCVESQLSVLPQHFSGSLAIPGYSDWIMYNHEFYRLCRQVYGVVDHLIKQLLAHGRTTGNKTELRSEAFNVLIAGRDTTASFLSWLFYLLVRNAQVFTILREAIVFTFGFYNEASNITFSALKNCTYLRYTLNETLRLFFSLSLNRRRAAADTCFSRGGEEDGLSPIYIRKGEEVIYSVYVLHRRKDLWGDDADKFRPERWERRKHGYIIVRLLQQFDAIERYGVSKAREKIRHGLTFANASADSVKIRLRGAKDYAAGTSDRIS
ncbi:cytochrome P450 [Bisporella sp. PMI_857]|nr:cytochrome P450 [Bisporella sp. PMI_857]